MTNPYPPVKWLITCDQLENLHLVSELAADLNELLRETKGILRLVDPTHRRCDVQAVITDIDAWDAVWPTPVTLYQLFDEGLDLLDRAVGLMVCVDPEVNPAESFFEKTKRFTQAAEVVVTHVLS